LLLLSPKLVPFNDRAKVMRLLRYDKG